VGFGLSARAGPAREILVVGGSPLKGNSYHSFGLTFGGADSRAFRAAHFPVVGSKKNGYVSDQRN
jgi:hypothetical protein